jgi:hypothetical protein
MSEQVSNMEEKVSKKIEIWRENRKFGNEKFNKPEGYVTNTLGEAEGNLSGMEEVLWTFLSQPGKDSPVCVTHFQVTYRFFFFFLPGNL